MSLGPLMIDLRGKTLAADEREWLLVMKTPASHFAAVEARVKALHSYQVPEVIAVPIQAGSEEYLRWVREETVGKGGRDGS